MPPGYIWAHEEELDSWFSELKRRRAEKYGSSGDSDGDQEAPMMDNQLAEGMRGR